MRLPGKWALKNFRERAKNSEQSIKIMQETNTEDDFVVSLPALLFRALARTLVESGFQMVFACHINFNQTSFYSAEAWKKSFWCCLVPGPATESTGWQIPPVRTKVHPSPVGMPWRVSPARGRGFKAGIVSAAQNCELSMSSSNHPVLDGYLTLFLLEQYTLSLLLLNIHLL